MPSTITYRKEIPATETFDVLVCGAGMAGVAAAASAARSGLKTGLVEYFGKPGGIPVSGGLGIVSGFAREREPAVAGIAEEIRQKMIARGGLKDTRDLHHAWDPEILSELLLEMISESNVQTYFYTQLIDAEKEQMMAKRAIVASKSGIEALSAKIFVDATGDGDLACQLGCPFEKGRSSDGLMQSATLVIKIGGIPRGQFFHGAASFKKMWLSKARLTPGKDLTMMPLPYPGPYISIIINTVHIGRFDGTRKEELTRARLEGMRQADEILSFFKSEVPGCEHAYLDDTAAQIGVRETRHIIGDYILSDDDVFSGSSFDDEIARCGYALDIHQPFFDAPDPQYEKLHTRKIEESFGIPYRCLTPKTINNLYVVGRCISASHAANGPSRINATCTALGQAAGVAARFAIEAGNNTRKVDYQALRSALTAQGAIIGLAEHVAQSRKARQQMASLVEELSTAKVLLDIKTEWRFKTDPSDVGGRESWQTKTPDATWSPINIDDFWTSQGFDYHGVGWYSTIIDPPAFPEDARSCLFFQAVDGSFTVWINGEQVDAVDANRWDHPWALDLIRFTAMKKPWRLTVRVRKDSEAAGIWKPVEIRIWR